MRKDHTTIEIHKETHRRLKIYSAIHRLKVSDAGNNIIKDFLNKEGILGSKFEGS